MKKPFDPRQLSLDFRVKLEPALEPMTAGKHLAELEAQARVYYRWAKQIWMKAAILRADLALPPAPRSARRFPCPRSTQPFARN